MPAGASPSRARRGPHPTRNRRPQSTAGATRQGRPCEQQRGQSPSARRVHSRSFQHGAISFPDAGQVGCHSNDAEPLWSKVRAERLWIEVHTPLFARVPLKIRSNVAIPAWGQAVVERFRGLPGPKPSVRPSPASGLPRLAPRSSGLSSPGSPSPAVSCALGCSGGGRSWPGSGRSPASSRSRAADRRTLFPSLAGNHAVGLLEPLLAPRRRAFSRPSQCPGRAEPSFAP